MSKKKLFKISAAVAGFLLGTGLMSNLEAGRILKNSPTGLVDFSVYSSTASSYKAGLEIYNPGGTATSPATTVIALRFANTEISGGAVNPDWTVVFNFTDGDARFSTIGPNYVWVLADPTTGNIYASSTAGAIGPMITLTSGNVDLVAQGIVNMPSNTNLFLYQAAWTDGDGDGLVDPAELGALTNSTVVLLNKSADCNTHPVWPLTASISGANGNILFPTVSFAYVTPQFTVAGPNANSLNAELDADADFNTFIVASNPNIIATTHIQDSSFFSITNQQTGEPQNWIAWSSTGVSGRITFDLSSVINEPNVTAISFGGPCTETTTDRVWHCDSGVIPSLIGNFQLDLLVSGSSSNNPTFWSISNVNITGGLCYNIPPRGVGSWWGGVEAIVPFVKYDPSVGAQTYIVLYNRRNVDVPVYARALISDSNPIVTSINQIGTIPAQGMLRFTADQLQSLLPELAGYNMADGVPIKFLFKVPTQATTISGGTTFVNPSDPYIEGIVVSVYGSEQRSVPLKFKAFKQGNYNE